MTRRAVDVRTACDLLGLLLKWSALAFAAPAAVALGAGEHPWPFVIAAVATAAAGFALQRLTPQHGPLWPREALLLVALVWTVLPVFGALPFLVGGVPQLDRPVDAYFEAVSGFTATGATVVTDVDELGRGMLFWRQLTHWLGGMGIIVLAIAVLPRLRIGGRQLLRSELPGPSDVEPLDATVRETARRLWMVYVGVSLAGILLLATLGWTGLDAKMDLFEAFSHATSATSLGGFSSQPDSVSGFAPITQWVLCGLMVIAGINVLRLYRLFVLRRVRTTARDEELRLYLALLVVGAGAVAIELFADGSVEGLDGIRHAVFQAVSVMTTTGLATLDWGGWGALATLTLLILMFVGASAGSPSGSIKIVRHLMLFRLARRELEQAVQPEVVVPVRLNGKPVDARTLRSAVMFVVFYVLTFAAGALLLTLDARRAGSDLSVIEALGAAAACLGNVGAGFGSAGPFGSYAGFSDVSKALLTAMMVVGRVEIVPIAVLVTRAFRRT